MRTLIEATTAAVAVSSATAMMTTVGFPVFVSAVGLADGDVILIYKKVGDSFVAAVDRAVPEAATLTFAKPDIQLTGGPVYAFGKGTTDGAASVVAWP